MQPQGPLLVVLSSSIQTVDHIRATAGVTRAMGVTKNLYDHALQNGLRTP